MPGSPYRPPGYWAVSIRKYPLTLTWYRTAAARASCSGRGIRPAMSTISQVTNMTRKLSP